MKVVILQTYNTPYRNELFNQIKKFEEIDLYLVYIGEKSSDRKWGDKLISHFKEVQIKCKIENLSYEIIDIQVSYFDFLIKLYKINPDILISTLGKYTLFLKYAFFWKKLGLIHWSEETIITAKGKKGFQKKYLFVHRNYPKAYVFPGKMAYDFHKISGLNVKNDNVFFAPNSVDDCYSITSTEIENKFKNTGKIRFLYIGSFIKLKGFDLLINSLSSIENAFANIEFHIAGDGPIKPNSAMFNHGFVNQKEIIKLYKSCHIFIMPSLWDCNPLAVIEAARCGCILLLSDGVGNYPELIDGNGYVFERNSITAIIDAIKGVLKKTIPELIAMSYKSVELSKNNNHRYSAAVFYDAIKFVLKK